MFRVVVFVLGIVSSISSAHAAHFSKVAPSGVPIILNELVSINPDCSAYGRPVVRPLRQPENGRLIIQNTSVFPSFDTSNPRSACNRRRVPGVVIKYVSHRGYTGMDAVAVQMFIITGLTRRDLYRISVR